ncbi:MAG: hypothetical protein IJ193_04010 [Bacilli bacterium]|nr:hypothetical protein [Bacilli bacterium]
MNIGFTIGKFAPLHLGHDQLIQKGIQENDLFYILINDTDVTDISLEVRANWLKELYPDANILLGTNPPKRYGMDPESIQIQTDYLKKMFHGIPVTRFYSGEKYGEYVADAFGIENVFVPKEIDISATKIRNNPEKYQKYLKIQVYNDYINKKRSL